MEPVVRILATYRTGRWCAHLDCAPHLAIGIGSTHGAAVLRLVILLGGEPSQVVEDEDAAADDSREYLVNGKQWVRMPPRSMN